MDTNYEAPHRNFSILLCFFTFRSTCSPQHLVPVQPRSSFVCGDTRSFASI